MTDDEYKEYRKDYFKAYYRKHREKRRAYFRKYYKANKEKIIQRNKEKYQEKLKNKGGK